MIKIGCDNLVYAIMKTVDTKAAAPTFDAPKNAPGVQSININPNASVETAFGDDGPMETASTLGKIDVEIQKAYLTAENQADLLGKAIDSKGGLVSGSNDTPPWVAVGFRTLKSNGHYRYVWLYKVRFMDPEDNNETKGDSINFQSETIKGQGAKLNFGYKVDGKVRYPWKYEIDEDTLEADDTTLEGWFTAVVLPTADLV